MTITINTPMSPPHWAFLQRELLRATADACVEFNERYFDERGYLKCVPRWGGDDGPDDAAENQLNWTMLHALGAPDIILELFRKGFDGHIRQYTEAKTVEVPLAQEGMYYKEFPVMFDWFHHGEGLSAFTLQGLSDPDNDFFRQRSLRWAAMYMDEDPQAKNYDPEHKIIRSLFNGSRGPLLRKATGLDWAGDPIEIEDRFRLGHGERTFQEMIDHFKDYTDIVGDHPINLSATTLGFNAYAITAESKYRNWMLEYIDAWVERTTTNSCIIPSNIGLDGTIGGECNGKWYGGCYGWAFTVVVPQTGQLAHRPACYSRAHYGFANALLMTGDQRYIDVWRNVLDAVNANAREIDGQMMYPHMYGDDGWYDHRPEPFGPGALELYYWSMKADDRKRVEGDKWLEFLDGNNPNYPVQSLQNDLEDLRRRIDRFRSDGSTPDTRLSDDMNGANPALTQTLTQQMLGGLPTGRVGFPLHCRLRYLDPIKRRGGIPEGVAALVDSMSDDRVTVQFVNLNLLKHQSLIVQAGAYAEHQIISVDTEDSTTLVDASHFTLHLKPGAGCRLSIRMKRYTNQPTFAFPWNREK